MPGSKVTRSAEMLCSAAAIHVMELETYCSTTLRPKEYCRQVEMLAWCQDQPVDVKGFWLCDSYDLEYEPAIDIGEDT